MPVRTACSVTRPLCPDSRDQVCERLARGDVVVLSGAGLSTESGIPDYRGATGVARRNHAPMTYEAFIGDAASRRRYWARSHLGWRLMSEANPNDGHLAVAQLERLGHVTGTITQNVDGLHTAAGSRRVIDLHGRLDRVICLDCRTLTSRIELDRRLTDANPQWRAVASRVNPDGDVELTESDLAGFTVVACDACGGILKPDVVYFGESVPRDRVATSLDLVHSAATLLVLGSSLTVFSGRRFVLAAAKAGIPIVIVNEGPTRCDDIAAIRIQTPLGETLRGLVDHLTADGMLPA